MTAPTDVLLACSSQAADWRRAFARLLPDLTVHAWPQTPEVVDFAIVWKPPSELFERVRVRRAIFNLGAGVDSLLGVPALPRDVPIVRLEDAGMAAQMAEYVTLAVLRAYREHEQYAEQQRERRWHPRERLPKATFGVGLLGLGVLGRAVASALAPFGFPLYGWGRASRVIPGMATFTGEDGLRTLLARTRVLVVLLPSTPDTRGMLDRSTLRLLPAGAHLVNVARGDVVVEADLLDLLDEGHLASATLDVFEREPLPPDHRFWHHRKIVLTPHVSAATLVDESAMQVVAKLRALSRGEPVTGIVDWQRGY